MARRSSHDLGRRTQARDVALRSTRRLTTVVAGAATGLAGLLSVVSAQAFKGHGHSAAPSSSAATTTTARHAAATVPPPEHVPAISGDGLSAPPSAPSNPAPSAPSTPAPAPSAPSTPAPAAPAPAPAPAPTPPVSSGGS